MSSHVSVATKHPNDDREIPVAYYQIPKTWLEAPGAQDQAPDDDAAVRLFAVSAAHDGAWVFVRYIHPRGGVKTKFTQATQNDSGWYPTALERGSSAYWPRTVVPDRGDEPDGGYRGPELEWFDDLWADRETFQLEVVA